jgi:hypothetical protein
MMSGRNVVLAAHFLLLLLKRNVRHMGNVRRLRVGKHDSTFQNNRLQNGTSPAAGL